MRHRLWFAVLALTLGAFALGGFVGPAMSGRGNDVPMECAAAHVAAEVVREAYGGSTHGIPNRETDEIRDEVFHDAYERLDEACGGLDQPRDLWLRYDELISEDWMRTIDHSNPEWLPWYQETICPTLDDEGGICTLESDS